MIRNARAQTRFDWADSRLSDLASQILQINQSEYECHEDIRAFGAPSECGKMVHDSYCRLRQKAFLEYDMTEEEFFEEVGRRTSDHWVYYHSGLTW